ncbi:MAG: hypothetical protein PHH77_07760 [Victivallaceae bacterium]|nr:hypothetical protein [Victivallaceae bacterium]
MAKIKYYQLAVNMVGQAVLFISPNQKVIDQAASDGYTVKGYDCKDDIPTNPILDNGEVREMTKAEIATAADAAENARQAAKSDKLKAAENAYLTLLAGLTVSITAEDNSDTIITKLTESGMNKVDAVEIGLKLLNAIHEIELQGGSWYDLPAQLHETES